METTCGGSSMSRKAMQMALDAMMTIRPYEVVDYDQLEASITALRQALETEQEPFEYWNAV